MECERLSEQVRNLASDKERLETDLKDLAATAASNSTLVSSLEGKVRTLASEKRDFELLITR